MNPHAPPTAWAIVIPFIFVQLWVVNVTSIGLLSQLSHLISGSAAMDVTSFFETVPPLSVLMARAVGGETLTGIFVAVLGVWLAPV